MTFFTYWWPAGYRGTPKIFLYTGKILQVVSQFKSAFLVSICYVIKYVIKQLLSKPINEPEVDFVNYVTIAPCNSKILCLLKRDRKGHQVQVCSSGLFVSRGIELSHDLLYVGYKWRRTCRC